MAGFEMDAETPARRVPRVAGWLVAAVLTLIVLSAINPFVMVPAGERAVLFSLSGGTRTRVLGEGMHLIVPFVERPIFYDVRTQTYTMSRTPWEGEVRGEDALAALTSDGQVVTVDISVRFHPDAARLHRLHQSLGPEYVSKVIRPEIRSQTRLALAEYPVEDVFARKREAIQEQIARRLTESLNRSDIVVDEVLLRNIQFSPAFAAAIEEKQIAQQNAQRMKYVLQKAQLEKQQKVLEAQGEARSIDLRGQAIAQNARIVQYEYVRRVAPNVSTIITTDGGLTAPAPPRP